MLRLLGREVEGEVVAKVTATLVLAVVLAVAEVRLYGVYIMLLIYLPR